MHETLQIMGSDRRPGIWSRISTINCKMCHCPTCFPPENGIDPDPRAQEMMLEQHGRQADAQCFVRRCCKGDFLSF